MNPTPLQRVFASKWPVRIWFSTISLGTVAYSLSAPEFGAEYATNWSMAGWYLYLGTVGAALGLVLGVIPGWFFLGPLLRARGLANGAPFREGDTVQIIVGPHRDTVTRIYSKWQGASVKVDLGPEAQSIE